MVSETPFERASQKTGTLLITKPGIRLLEKYEMGKFTVSVERHASTFVNSPDAQANFDRLLKIAMKSSSESIERHTDEEYNALEERKEKSSYPISL